MVYDALQEYIRKLSLDVGQDVKAFHFERTMRHIAAVTEQYVKLVSRPLRRVPGVVDIQAHDVDKLTLQEQILPYVLTNWKYKCALTGVTYEIPDEFKEECYQATIRHVQCGRHHPEFWDPDQTDLISRGNRDGISRVIDGTKMPLEYIEEMAADIFAVAAERGNTPQSWVEKNLGKRWNLTEEASYLLINSVNYLSKGIDKR